MSIHKISALGAFLCGLFGCAGVWVAHQRQVAVSLEVDKTHRVRDEIELTYRACLNAETGQRGFLLTGRRYYLEPNTKGVIDARAHLTALQGMLPDKGEDVARLSREVEDKFEEMDDTIKKVISGDKPGAYTIVDSDRGKKSMERIRAALDQLIAAENLALNRRRAEAREAAQTAIATTLGFMVLAAVLSGFSTLGRR